MKPPVPAWILAVGVAGALVGQEAAELPGARGASGGLVVQLASNGIERVRILHPLHGWSTTLPVVPGQAIRLEGLFPGDYVVEGWATGIVAGRSVGVAAGSPAVVELKECWIPPDEPDDEGERVVRRYARDTRHDRSVRIRAERDEHAQLAGATGRRATGGRQAQAPDVASSTGDPEEWVLANCSSCVLLSAFDAESGAPVPVIELRDEGHFQFFGSNCKELETPIALPSTSFDPVVWAWRPWSVWWVRAPGYRWQRVVIDHSVAGTMLVGLVRAEAPKEH